MAFAAVAEDKPKAPEMPKPPEELKAEQWFVGSWTCKGTMQPGEISGPINTGSSGAVLSLVDRQAPSPADFQKQKDQVREQVQQEKRNQVLELFIANLREQMEKSGKIQINQQVLKQLTAPRNEAS